MKRFGTLMLTLALSLSTSSCDFVGDVLEFGFWAIVILSLLVFGLAWGLFRMVTTRSRRRPPP